MKNIAVLISGSGSNLQSLIDSCENGTINGKISIVISNRKNAFGLERSQKHGIEALWISKKDKTSEEFDTLIYEELKKKNIDLIVLAGYLNILTPILTNNYQIINIHPSLIPAFCGKGYHGMHVHEAVVKKGVKYTGATTHFVDEGVDTGYIIDQVIVPVNYGDSAEQVASNVLVEEHKLLVKTVKAFCEDRIIVENNSVKILED